MEQDVAGIERKAKRRGEKRVSRIAPSSDVNIPLIDMVRGNIPMNRSPIRLDLPGITKSNLAKTNAFPGGFVDPFRHADRVIVAACAKTGESRQFENRGPNDPDKSARNSRRQSPQCAKEPDSDG